MPPKGPSKKRKAAGGSSSDAVNGESGEATLPAPAAPTGGASIAGGQAYAPLKPADGAPLLRRDLQWDTLETIFTSYSPRFTPPSYTDDALALFPRDRDWSFAELYLDCIANSNKANRNLKDKMSESTAFAVNFAKLCLLINVGRINTTLAFYPEMKTALRTYHPIPSMQLDEFSKKNLQDAPRMKAQLKGCHLPSDAENPPDSLAEVIRRATVLGWKPPACVATCIFLLYNEWTRISQKYFPEGFILPDLFYPGDPKNTIPSIQRSQAFLWLVHRFLKTPELVASDFANGEARLPEDQLLNLTRQDCSNENVDPEEELAFGLEMQRNRDEFVERYMKPENYEFGNEASAASGGEEVTPGPEDRKGKATRLDKTAGRQARAASTTPAKKARSINANPDTDSTPLGASPLKSQSIIANPDLNATSITASPLKSTVQAVSDVTPVSTVKIEQGLVIYAPPPGFIASGIMTPTIIVPQAPAAGSSTAFYSHADLWRHALKKKKGGAAAAVAKLVPASEGLAEPEILYQWNQFYQSAPRTGRSQLQLAWQKIKRDMEQNRDPVYDSEDEADWTPEELQPRASGFSFRNHQTNSKDVVRYQGHGPPFDSDQPLHYLETMDHNERPRNSVTPTPQYQTSAVASSSPQQSGHSPILTNSPIKMAQMAVEDGTSVPMDTMVPNAPIKPDNTSASKNTVDVGMEAFLANESTGP